MTQKTRAAITTEINARVIENTSGLITATQVNGILNDINESSQNTLTDVPVTSRQSAKSAFLLRQPQSSARCVAPLGLSNGTDLGTTFRSYHVTVGAVSNMRIAYANIIYTNGGLETAAVQTIVVSAAVEYPQGTVIPVTFNGGSPTVSIPVGGIALCDPVGIRVPAATKLWCRQHVVNSGSDKWPTGLQNIFLAGNSNQDGDSIGGKISNATNATPIVISSQGGNNNLTTGDTVNITGILGNTAANGTWTVTVISSSTFSLNTSVGNGAFGGGGTLRGNTADFTKAGSGFMTGSGGTGMYSPTAILGNADSGVATAWCGIIGDSIAAGTGDTSNNSWVMRGLGGYDAPILPYINFAVAGTSAFEFADPLNVATQSEKRRKLCSAADYVIDEQGTNDLTRTLAQIQADLVSTWTFFASQASRVIACTLIPKTTSTDSWATTANQTVTANDSKRTGFNSWLRAGAPIVAGVAVAIGTPGALVAGTAGHPVWTVIDPAALMEVNASNALALNGGFWPVTGAANYATTDGTHPTTVIHIIMSACVPATSMVPF